MQSDLNQPLALSDIMHTLSPSPGPPPEDHVEAVDGNLFEQSVEPDCTAAQDEPEFMTGEELQTMQARLRQAGLFVVQPMVSSSSSHTPLELELGHMVSRLLSQCQYLPPQHLSEQLASQAETIASLTAQRDLLLRRYTDARASWEVERQGWERSSEALTRQRAAAAATTKEEIVDRLVARLEDENKRLRNKIAELRNRLIDVEAELYSLRPLLLIPPVHPGSSGRTKSLPKSAVSRKSRTEIIAEADSLAVEVSTKQPEAALQREDTVLDVDLSQVSALQTTEPDTATSSTQTLSTHATISTLASSQEPLAPSRPHSYYRTSHEREMDLAIPTPRKTRSSAQAAGSSTPSKQLGSTSTTQVLSSSWTPQTRADQRAASSLLSDARAELMLHAARKIGKRRAGLLAGLVVQPRELVQQSGQDESGAKGKGKERAGSRASFDKGKGRETEEQEGATPVKKQRKRIMKRANTIPKASSGASTNPTGGGYYGSLPSMSHLVYVNPMHAGQRMGPVPVPMPGSAPGAMPLFVPMSGIWPPMVPPGPAALPSSSSPGTSKVAQAMPPAEASTPTRSAATPSAAQTPGLGRTESAGTTQGLDSLLSAARMLADDEGSQHSRAATPVHVHTPKRASRRARGAADTLEVATPTPKRRKVMPSTPQSVSGATVGETMPVHTPTPKARGGQALGRISSALEVLADQAAQEQERRPATPSRKTEGPSRPTTKATRRRRLSGRGGGVTRGADATLGKGKAKADVQPFSADTARRGLPEVEQHAGLRRVSTELNSSREATPPPASALSIPRQKGPTTDEKTPEAQVAGAMQAAPDPAQPLSAPEAKEASPSGTKQVALPQVASELSPARTTTPLSDTDAPGSPENLMDIGE